MKRSIHLPMLAGLCIAISSCAELPQSVNISGRWKLDEIHMACGENADLSNPKRCAPEEIEPVCVFRQTGVSLSGACTGPANNGTVSGTISDGTLKFTLVHVHPDGTPGKNTLQYTGTLESDHRMIGWVYAGGGRRGFVAVKQNDVALVSPDMGTGSGIR